MTSELKIAEVRFYPLACQSAYCGRCDCPSNCPSLPRLKEFKAWVARTKAICKDPIWCPTAYEAKTK